MPRDGTLTRTRILDAAQALILDRGYAATTLEQILEAAQVTKGSFFYHFRNKNELAVELVRRFADADTELLEATMSRAAKLSGDPLQQVLLLVGLYEEMLGAADGPPPGCLFASYCYESELMSDEVREIIVGAIARASDRIEEKLREAAARHPPRTEVDLRSLADLWTTIFEGAFVMARTLPRPAILLDQLRHYRAYVALLFGVEGATADLTRG